MNMNMGQRGPQPKVQQLEIPHPIELDPNRYENPFRNRMPTYNVLFTVSKDRRFVKAGFMWEGIEWSIEFKRIKGKYVEIEGTKTLHMSEDIYNKIMTGMRKDLEPYIIKNEDGLLKATKRINRRYG